MKLKQRVIDITALEWKGHEENVDCSAMVARYDLSGEKYQVIGYETALDCCGKMLQEHGYLNGVSLLEEGQVICPGMYLIVEVNLNNGNIERVRAMRESDIWKEYERP